MQVLPILNNNNYKISANTQFKSTSRCVFNSNKQIICNYTKFFREDLEWKNFVELLSKKYNNASRINIMNMACSDGSEPVTLMTKLLFTLKEKAQKFFPIYASDIDDKIIEEASSYEYKINEDDLFRVNMNLGHYSNYFSIIGNSNTNFPYKLLLNQKHCANILFNQMDMIQAANYIKSQNNVILCRNVIPYLSYPKQERFVDTLAEKLDSTSLIVLGAYDNGHGIDGLVRSRGFKSYGLENVYCKC